jgi:hypothetical protein
LFPEMKNHMYGGIRISVVEASYGANVLCFKTLNSRTSSTV